MRSTPPSRCGRSSTKVDLQSGRGCTLEPMTSEWGIDAVDLDAYLARIGQEPQPPSEGALAELMRAHVQTIPFENVDVVLRQPQGISLDVVSAKLVGRRRGGYCYEQSGLFAAVLEQLGYRAPRLPPPPRPRR